MSTPARVLVPIDDSDPSALVIALGYAKAIAQRGTPRTDKIVLLTHTKEQLRGTSLERHLGVQAAKALASNQAVRVGEDLMLHHATLKTLRFGIGRAVILAFYAEDTQGWFWTAEPKQTRLGLRHTPFGRLPGEKGDEPRAGASITPPDA